MEEIGGSAASTARVNCSAASGAGNPSKGTGGLLIISTNHFINNGIISSNGSSGGTARFCGTTIGGGGSGGGTINVFCTNLIKKGTLQANGGSSVANSGMGGSGTVTIGIIEDGNFIKK